MSDEPASASAPAAAWVDVGSAAELATRAVSPALLGTTPIAITCVNGEFGALSGVCNHAGGPLGEGRIQGEYLTCPWHNWKYHYRTGLGEPGFEADAVPSYAVKVENERLFVSEKPISQRTRGVHPPHPLARRIERAPGPVRLVGISTTNMDVANPRYSTSDASTGGCRSPVHCRDGAAGRDEDDSSRGPQVPAVRGLLLEERACVHVAVFHNSNGSGRSDGDRLRGDRPLGRRDSRVHTHSLGQCELAVLPHGRAHELRPEPGDDRQPCAAAKQG